MDTQEQHRRRPGRGALALAALGIVVLLVVAADRATSSPALCGSCHEMAPSHASWSQSAHANVKCVACHETPREWYGTPARYAERGRLLGRDTWRHLTGRIGERTDPRAIGRTSPMPDEVCLQCHSPDRRATSGFRILIDHVEHAERTGSCVACHVFTAHPDEALGRPLSLMTRCLDCHGTAEYPEAPDACGTCHPSDFDLRPPSHIEEPWMRDHGFEALADRDLCTLCHEQSYCDGCHGLEMPHPEGWLDGPVAHSATAERDRELCATCHTEEPDSCTVCHHETYDPARGTWIEQHGVDARTTGAAACLQCHAPTSCAECHMAPADVGE